MTTEIVERDCTIELDGRRFESGGAVVTDDRIVAYAGIRIPAIVAEYPWRTQFAVQTWHGERIGSATVTGTWTVRGTRFFSYCVHLDRLAARVPAHASCQ